MATPQIPPETGLKERFFRYFQHEVTGTQAICDKYRVSLTTIALQEQMERLNQMSISGGERNDAVDHCLAGIDRLSHEVKDASSYIPAYDQRTYSEVLLSKSSIRIHPSDNRRQSMHFPKSYKISAMPLTLRRSFNSRLARALLQSLGTTLQESPSHNSSVHQYLRLITRIPNPRLRPHRSTNCHQGKRSGRH